MIYTRAFLIYIGLYVMLCPTIYNKPHVILSAGIINKQRFREAIINVETQGNAMSMWNVALAARNEYNTTWKGSYGKGTLSTWVLPVHDENATSPVFVNTLYSSSNT